MKSLWKFLLVGMMAMALTIAGCSDSNNDGGTVSDPATGSGLTNSSGVADFTAGSTDINVTVTDTAGANLPGMAVNAYLLPDHVMIMVIDSTENYYPSIAVASYGSVASVPSNPSNDRLNSPASVQRAAVDVTVVMHEASIAVFGFDPDISNFMQIYDNNWTDETCDDLLLEDIYNIADTSDNTFEQGIFIHLSDEVVTATGSEFGTVVLMPSDIDNFQTFAALAGYTLRLFQGDSLQTCWTSYDGTDLPIFLINDVVLNRNFWCQFTLIWGQYPEDLDSHLWTPTIQGDSFHVYFGNPGSSTSAPYADLDVDDVTSYGPEHVTIYDNFTGTYTYAIYDWSGDGLISTSNAIVSLIKPDGSVQTFNVPTGSSQAHWWWHVCTIDGTTGVVTPINILSANPPLPEFAPANVVKKAPAKK